MIVDTSKFLLFCQHTEKIKNRDGNREIPVLTHEKTLTGADPDFLEGGQPMFQPNGPKNYIKMKTWSQGEGDASKILLCRSASEN